MMGSYIAEFNQYEDRENTNGTEMQVTHDLHEGVGTCNLNLLRARAQSL